jgi:hypothetical protein
VIGLAIGFLIVIDIYNSWYFYNVNVIKQVTIVASNTPRSYMIRYIIEHMCNSNVIALQLVDHVNFLCKCLWTNGMPPWLFIHPLMDEVCLYLLQFTFTLPLVVHIKFSCKCHERM